MFKEQCVRKSRVWEDKQLFIYVYINVCMYIIIHTKIQKHIAASTQAFCAIFLLDLLLKSENHKKN